jgi:hypothetical protein
VGCFVPGSDLGAGETAGSKTHILVLVELTCYGVGVRDGKQNKSNTIELLGGDRCYAEPEGKEGCRECGRQ